MSVPDEFTAALQRYQPYLDEEAFAKLSTESHQSAPSAVRLNLLKSTTPSLQRLQFLRDKYGWTTKELPFSKDSLQVIDWKIPPSQTLEFQLGQYYLQDAASILPVSLFSQSDKPMLKLDMAASPGGKTTQLVDASLDKDFVIANDSAASRLSALRTVLQTWGAANCAITNYPGERWGDWFPETFDQILLDAPCSMQSLRTSSSHPHRPITEDERGRLASRQTALLFSAAKALKTGGELVYSTCTLAPEEDEAVVSALLEAFPGTFHIDRAPAKQYQVSGLTEFEGQSFHPDVIHALRIWPFVFHTNGFFAVKLIKDKPTGTERIEPPSRDFSATGFKPLSSKLYQELVEMVESTYGFDLDAQIKHLSIVPMRKVDGIQLIPTGYLDTFSSLPYNAIGMPLGRFIRDQLEVSVDFVLRFGEHFTRNFWQIPEDLIDAWMRGFDIRGIDPEGIEPGTVITIRDIEGNNLGAAKYSSKRLRNLLPNRNISH